MNYNNYIASKRHTSQNFGIEPLWIPDEMFDYQKYVAEYDIRKGRCANFLDTGTGKTIIELVRAANYVRHTNKPVLILTPLAVAFQFIKESERFGIDDVSYCRDGKYKSKIVIANYERLHYFDPEDFDCVILDESSILKDADSATRIAVTAFLRKVKYRALFTATPSPNDFEELGTSSEALGYMGYHDMLTKFFTNNSDTISPNGIGVKWRISKEPLKVRMRTMVKSLMHKMIVEDSTEAYPSMPDYLLIFQKKGKRHTPVTHPVGFTHYAGEIPLLPHMVKALKGEIPDLLKDGVTMDEVDEMWAVFEALKVRYAGFKPEMDHKTNRLSHNIWRRYADAIWHDIRIDNVLPFKDSKEEDDEKHVHPLQLDVIDRVVELWSNPGDVVLTPFMGVGSEVFSPVSMGRKAIGVELKDSYFKQAILNCKEAEKRFTASRPKTLFDSVEEVMEEM